VPGESPFQSTSPFALARMHHTALRVPDMEASKRWFIEKFEFRVLREWAMGEHRCAWLGPSGDDSFHIEIVGGNSPEPKPEFGTVEETLEYSGYHHVSIDVASVDHALGELRRRGVKVIGEPFVVTALGRRVAFVTDPWGNLFEIGEAIA
jgi:catechol 2,3-dioxygenase-like lactoylglutathione lyase family enzyme